MTTRPRAPEGLPRDVAADLRRCREQLARGDRDLALLTYFEARHDLGWAIGYYADTPALEAQRVDALAVGELLVKTLRARSRPEVNPHDVADVVVKGLEPLLRSGAEITEERLVDRSRNVATALVALYEICERGPRSPRTPDAETPSKAGGSHG